MPTEEKSMARINLERRAAIGEAKRARTRAAILEAARARYTAPTNGAVTVEAVMQAAGLAKGTFYLHFPDLATLEAELGEALIGDLDQRLQPARLAVSDPLSRLATMLTLMLRDLAAAPAQARLAARAVATIPDVARAVQAHLREDLAETHSEDRLAIGSIDLAARIVAAIFEEAARDLGDGRIDATAIPDIVRAVLRAMGCAPKDAAKRADEATRNADAFAQPTTVNGSEGS
jgi:AcrR family transcriptional regulator